MLQTSGNSFAPSLFSYTERDLAVEQLHAATAIYTRSNLIDPLLHRLGWPNTELSLFDPARGDGAFLVRALSAVRLPVDDIAALAQICGWEIHPHAAAEARADIAAHLRQNGWCSSLAHLSAGIELQPLRKWHNWKMHLIGQINIVRSASEASGAEGHQAVPR